MKSEKRTELKMVERVHWTCAVASHRHKTQAFADKCLKKYPTGEKGKAGHHWTDEDCAQVVAWRDAGRTLKSIGEHFGVGTERIRQIESRTRMRAHRGVPPNV